MLCHHAEVVKAPTRLSNVAVTTVWLEFLPSFETQVHQTFSTWLWGLGYKISTVLNLSPTGSTMLSCIPTLCLSALCPLAPPQYNLSRITLVSCPDPTCEGRVW